MNRRKTTYNDKSRRQQPKRTPAKSAPVNSEASQPVDIESQIFQAKNKSQELAWSTIKENNIIFLTGPAGTAKTHLATAYAIINTKKRIYDKVVITRPLVEAHEHLGWLPGEVQDKVAPYMEPIESCASKIGKKDIEIITKPIAFMRGVTFQGCIHILDEAQNCTRDQLKLYLTRYGKKCKIIICGDCEQSDIPDSGLSGIIEDLKGLPKIGVFNFTTADIVRHPLVALMVERFNETDKKLKRQTAGQSRRTQR